MIKTETVVGVFDTDKGLTSVATPSGVGQTFLMSYNPTTQTITDPAQRAAVVAATATQAGTFTSRALTASDNGGVFYTSASQVVTINSGVTGFNTCVFYGPVTFTGTATIEDKRTTGADTDVAMVQRLPAADAFRIIGSAV